MEDRKAYITISDNEYGTVKTYKMSEIGANAIEWFLDEYGIKNYCVAITNDFNFEEVEL